MKNHYQVIKTVSVTEKSNALMEHNQYTFKVDPRATKSDIKEAVEHVFERKIKAVNVMNRLGKTKRTRFGLGKKPDWKRAIVTLKDGEEGIDLF